MSTAIVKTTEAVIAVTSQPIRSIDELRQAYENLRGKCNLLTPITHPNDILALHRVSLSVVMINAGVDGKGNGAECYHSSAFHNDGEVSLGKVGLLKLMQAAGLSVMGAPRKIDDGSDPHYSAYAVRVGGRDLRGIWREIEKEGRLDFRQGSSAIRGWQPKQLESARAHIDSRAETKALEKALRDFLALPGKFSRDQASLPFVVPVLIVDPDPSNPVDRAWLLNHGANTIRQLYGAAPATGSDEVRQLKDVTPPPALKPAELTMQAETSPPAEEESEDFKVLEPAVAPIVCGCPCGDQREVTAEVAKATTDAVGAVRCRACFPGRGFDYEQHKDVKSLNLPKKPNLTPAMVRDAVKAAPPAGGR